MCQICRACNHLNANFFGVGRRTLIFPEALCSSHPFPFPVPLSFFALQFRTCCFFLFLFSGLAAGAILGPSPPPLPSVCVSPLGRRRDGGRRLAPRLSLPQCSEGERRENNFFSLHIARRKLCFSIQKILFWRRKTIYIYIYI